MNLPWRGLRSCKLWNDSIVAKSRYTYIISMGLGIGCILCRDGICSGPPRRITWAIDKGRKTLMILDRKLMLSIEVPMKLGLVFRTHL